MCGIIGYTGAGRAQQVLLNGLKKIEYRGYDSCGVALVEAGHLIVARDQLRVADFAKQQSPLAADTGIGHTRWASCGEPSVSNAHPHLDCGQQIAVVHNGVITNFQSLKSRLAAEGHIFLAETDSEVLPHLIEEHYAGDLLEAVSRALVEVEGTYALAVIRAGEDKIVLARCESPLAIGLGENEIFAASDVTAFMEYTRRVVYMEDGDLAVATPQRLTLIRDGHEVTPEVSVLPWTVDEAHQAGYPHFMLKEIYEQPAVLRATLTSFQPETAQMLVRREGTAECLLMLACGTSYNAALAGKYIFEDIAGIDANIEMASEYNYYLHPHQYGRAVAISQSGETADTLKAVRKLQAAGCRVVAITNVHGSSLTRIADRSIFTQAGPEKSVAATKTYTAQLAILYGLALSGKLVPDTTHRQALVNDLERLPDMLQRLLENDTDIRRYGRFLAHHSGVYVLGRGINYPVALEGALKLKEVAYIHAEGYAAGELKHGPFALLGEKMPVIGILGRDSTREPMLNNLREIKARQAPLFIVADENDEQARELADYLISVPACTPIFSPLVNVLALQLLAYYTAVEKGCPVDFPRNLAKCVTVE